MSTAFNLNFFSSDVAQPLGWSLIHSLWQSFAIYLLVQLILKMVPMGKSGLRYVVATGGLFMMFASLVATFVYLYQTPSSYTFSHAFNFLKENDNHVQGNVLSLWHSLQNVISKYIDIILFAWLTGTIIFLVRIAGGWLYIARLKNNAIDVTEWWQQRVQTLASQLKIKKIIQLAESSIIQAPAVIGYIKPVILVPVGMLSGLSTAQLDAILIHELAHIKRHDYVVNIIQCIIESILFFNPFVWIVSGFMRREREHCCDDTVVEYNHNPAVYATALAQVEASMLQRYSLELSIGRNKHQLLNRIKRIMEKSVKNYSVRERLVPAALLVLGLVCASWLTMTSEKRKQDRAKLDNELAIKPDTIIKEKKNATYYSRKKIVTTDSNGEPHEEVAEEFDGDESLRPMMESFDMAFDFPAAPMMPAFDDDFPGMPPMPLMPTFFQMNMDTIPGIGWRDEEAWKNFGEEFEKNFQAKFGDFYEKHQKEIEKMMDEMTAKFDSQHSEEWQQKMEAQAQKMEAQAQKHEAMRKSFDEDAWKKQEEQMQKFEMDMKHWEENNAPRMHEMEENMKALEENMKGMEEKMQKFEKELKENLVNDGYLKNNESIESMHWDDDGNIKVNGNYINPKDQQKYKALHKKYFSDKKYVN